MVEIIPKGFFSRDYDIYEIGSLVASIKDRSFLLYEDTITINGVLYSVCIERSSSSECFLLSTGDKTIAIGTKRPGACFNSYVIAFEGRELALVRKFFSFHERSLIYENSRQIGHYSLKMMFFRQAVLDLDVEVPLEARIFIIWLAMSLKKKTLNATWIDRV